MKQEFDIYTGQLLYKEISFTFVFDGIELRLIPPREKFHEVSMWMFTSVGDGAYTIGEPIYIEDQFLEGVSNETQQNMVFIPTNNTVGCESGVLRIQIAAYVVLKYGCDKIDRIGYRSPEIDFIHPVNQAYSHCFSQKSFGTDGVLTLTTRGFDDTTTNKQEFLVDNKTVSVYFGITRGMSTKIGESPLYFYSTMMFEFEPTDDFMFIYHLCRIAIKFIQYLCYRKNVSLSSIDLSVPSEGGKHINSGEIYIINRLSDTLDESEMMVKGRYIKQNTIDGKEGELLSAIAADLLYTRHIPESYRVGRNIDAARFVMITAAFEWEFRRAYPEGIVKSNETKKVEQEATNEIQRLIENCSGRLKKKYKFLQKLVKSDSLQSEIEQVGKDFDDIIGILGKRLYSINSEQLDYREMGKRLSDQRNHFAHGDLSQEFIGLSLLDLIYLEKIVYAMQFKFYGVEESYIQNAINDLFH